MAGPRRHRDRGDGSGGDGRAGQHVPVAGGQRGAARPGTRCTGPCTGGRWTTRCTSRSAGERADRADPAGSGAAAPIACGRGRRRGDRLGQPRHGLLHRPPAPDDAGGDRRGVPGSGAVPGGPPGRRFRHRAHRRTGARSCWGRARHPLPGGGPGGGHDPLAAFGPSAAREVLPARRAWPTSATWSSTARWTPAPTRWPPTRSWWATTAASAAGRPRRCWCTRRRGRWTRRRCGGPTPCTGSWCGWLRHVGQRASIADPAAVPDAHGCPRARRST